MFFTISWSSGWKTSRQPAFIVSRFMKCILDLQPPQPNLCTIWPVSTALSFVAKQEPLSSLSLKDHTLKLTILLVLMTAARPQPWVYHALLSSKIFSISKHVKNCKTIPFTEGNRVDKISTRPGNWGSKMRDPLFGTYQRSLPMESFTSIIWYHKAFCQTTIGDITWSKEEDNIKVWVPWMKLPKRGIPSKLSKI